MRHTAVLAAIAAAAIATGGVLAANGGAQQQGERTLKFVVKSCQFKFVDVAPRARGRNAPPGAGDEFALSCPSFAQTGARAGNVDARCTFTKGGRRARGVCDGVYALADGDIHLAARLTESNDVTGAITGGTRAYAGARGTFTSVDRPGEGGGDPSDDTLTLLP